MRVLDTLSGKKREIKASKKGLKLFVCGPTVYDYSHIGHARTYIIFDAFVKYLRFLSFKVFYLQNITDIDDKIINRAKEQRINPFSLAKKFENEYFKDLKGLKITSVNKYAKASKFIPQIVDQIKRLIKKGHAYKIEGDGYYFDVSTFPRYGKLSKRTTEQANDAVSRIDENIKKRNKADFCLWKFYKKGAPFWNTGLGKGRPGWHIEDTAITEKYFGPQYDIHGGAVDLKFPHHEAEIAQQESASGKKPFVKIWMHTGFLLVNGEKMSKSLKNFITIREFLKKNSADDLKIIVLSRHYRSPVDYNEKVLRQAKNSLRNFQEFIMKLEFLELRAKNKNLTTSAKQVLKKFEKNFHAVMQDDFNTPKALAEIFHLINQINPKIWRISKEDAKALKAAITRFLGLFDITPRIPKIPPKIAKLAQKREILRRNEHFVPADDLRKQIERLGYKVEDTPFGPLVQKVKPKF